ncbi:hypothetical protein JCM10212_006614 [Sporobolomyces blumeae]
MPTSPAAHGKPTSGEPARVESSDGARPASRQKRDGTPALSASLLVIAPLPKPARDGHDYRVLLLKRHEKSSTYQNAFVFPGGNVDPIDRDVAAWSSMFPSLMPFTAGVPTDPTVTTDTSASSASTTLSEAEMQTVKMCAIRETFEESGVLLFEPNAPQGAQGSLPSPDAERRWNQVGEKQKTEWRERVHKNGRDFVRLFEEQVGQGARPAVTRLTHWANWVTPVMLPRRFDTHFFITVLPSSTSPASSATDAEQTPYYKLASSDGVETSIAEWLTPTQAIRRALAHTANLSVPDTTPTYAPQPHSMGDNPANSIILHPPQFYLLAELAHNHKSYHSLLVSASTSSQEGSRVARLVRPRTVKSFTPQIGRVRDLSGTDRAATLLPGDVAYNDSSSPDRLDKQGRVVHHGEIDTSKGPKHRTYVVPPNERTQGLTVLGVHREGLGGDFGPGWEDMSAGEIGTSKSKL